MSTLLPSDQQEPTGWRHPATRVASGAALAIVGAGAFSTMAGLLVDPLSTDFGWERGTIALAVSLSMALYGFTAPFAAALMDRCGVRRIAAAALAALSTGAILTTLMSEPWHFIVAWGLLIGLGTGSMALTFAALITDRWFASHRGLVTGALASASVLGQFLLLPALGWLTESHGWRVTLTTLALATAALAVAAYLLLADHPDDVGASPYGSTRRAPKPAVRPHAVQRTLRVLWAAGATRTFWLLCILFATCGASTNGVMWTHFVPAAHSHGMAVPLAASLLTIVGLANVGGTVASGWLTDRHDPRFLLCIYFLLRGLSLAVLPGLLGPTVGIPLVAFAVAFGILDLATVPPTIAVCHATYGRDGSITFGWVNAAHQIGAAATAYAGGVIWDTFGSYDLLWLTAGCLCIAAAALAWLVVGSPQASAGDLPDATDRAMSA